MTRAITELGVVIAFAGCGRIGFDARTDDGGVRDGSIGDVVALTHDEDGDGVPDVADTCPHVDGPQADSDGDGVGDTCDPNPSTPGDAIVLFSTMAPGDQPFAMTALNDGTWTQLPDALQFSGTLGGDQNLHGTLTLPRTLGSARVVVGYDITEIVPGSATNQNQFALALVDMPPFYLTEIDQKQPTYQLASITYNDGTNFTSPQSRTLATGIHTGPVAMQTTQRVGTSVHFQVTWLPGELYEMQQLDNVYQAATRIEININNLHVEIRYLIVITMP